MMMSCANRPLERGHCNTLAVVCRAEIAASGSRLVTGWIQQALARRQVVLMVCLLSSGRERQEQKQRARHSCGCGQEMAVSSSVEHSQCDCYLCY